VTRAKSRSHIPLRWPDGWDRSTYPREGNFSGDRTLTQAVRELYEELSRKDSSGKSFARDIEITCADGTANPTRHIDSGAAVYFTRPSPDGPEDQHVVLACDKWRDPAHNVWALVLHVRALRGLLRWGVGTTSQAFAGYVALPPSPDAAPYVPPPEGTPDALVYGGPWWEMLGFRFKPKGIEDVDAAYKNLARKVHPDVGGSETLMQNLNVARDEALTALGRQSSTG